MTRAILILLVSVLALCVGAPPSPADPPALLGEKEIKLAELDDEFKKRVGAAVGKGQEFLLSKALPDGRWLTSHDASAAPHGPYPHGGTALAVLTLIKCGVNPSREEIAGGFKFLKESWDRFRAKGMKAGPKSWMVYEVSLTLMALEALDRWRPATAKRGKTQAVGKILKQKGFDKWVKQLRDWLVANQVDAREIAAGAGARSGKSGGSKATGGKPFRPKEAWSYPLNRPMTADHSNTQYAVLGLRAAATLGYPPPPELWKGVLYHFLDMQETKGPKVKRKVLSLKKIREKGKTRTSHRVRTEAHITDTARGWGYPGGNMPDPNGGQGGTTGSMTTVGIACIAIAWYELQLMARGDAKRRLRRDPKLAQALAKGGLARMVETAKLDGFAWLSHHWSVTENPQLGQWHYYYLYGMERAGVLGGMPTIGGHDWYREGGDLLLNAQAAGGSWDSGKRDGIIPSTCFALLFLKRATVPLVASTK